MSTHFGYLRHLCNVRRRTPSDGADVFGHTVTAWTTVYTDLPCRYGTSRRGRFRLVEEVSKDVAVAEPTVWLHPGVEIKVGDQIVSVRDRDGNSLADTLVVVSAGEVSADRPELVQVVVSSFESGPN